MMFEKGGTCCPTCGMRQAHVHRGWLQFNATGKVLFTQVNCERCGWRSLIIRLNKDVPSEVYKELDEAVRKVFEKRRERDDIWKMVYASGSDRLGAKDCEKRRY